MLTPLFVIVSLSLPSGGGEHCHDAEPDNNQHFIPVITVDYVRVMSTAVCDEASDCDFQGHIRDENTGRYSLLPLVYNVNPITWRVMNFTVPMRWNATMFELFIWETDVTAGPQLWGRFPISINDIRRSKCVSGSCMIQSSSNTLIVTFWVRMQNIQIEE